MKLFTKKGDVSQVFIYASSAIIVALILYFGYRGIAGISQSEEDISSLQLKNALEKEIISMSSEYGSFKKVDFSIPKKFTSVCFAHLANLVDAKTKLFEDTSLTNQPETRAIIEESLNSGTQKNIFFVPDGAAALSLVSMQPDPAFFCAKVKAGRITLRLEGLGKGTKVSIP